MGNITLDIDIDPNMVAQKARRALKRGFKEGLKDTGNKLLEEGENFAEDEVMGSGRVWNKEVKRGFTTSENEFSRWYHWQGDITNPVPHADIVDRGLAPAGEITGSNPSVQDLMPWVVDNLDPSSYGGGDGDLPFDPGSGGGDDTPGGITDPDTVIRNYQSTTELGIPEQQFSSKYPRVAQASDGTTVIFKSHEESRGGTNAAVRNEVVWSRSQEIDNVNTGPRSRLDSTTIDGSEVEGTAQEYVENAESIGDKVYLGMYEDNGERMGRAEFAEKHKDFLVNTYSTDYLTDNRDRHIGNVHFNEDDEPRAIDNGGANFDGSLHRAPLIGMGEWNDYHDARNPDRLHQINNEILDAIEARLERLANDEDYRQAIINQAKEVHGENSDYYQFYKDTLGDDIGPGHILYEDDSGVPRWRRDVQDARDFLQGRYEYDPDADTGDDQPPPGDGGEDHIEEFDNILDDVL
jgi:hypothetical protein